MYQAPATRAAALHCVITASRDTPKYEIDMGVHKRSDSAIAGTTGKATPELLQESVRTNYGPLLTELSVHGSTNRRALPSLTSDKIF